MFCFYHLFLFVSSGRGYSRVQFPTEFSKWFESSRMSQFEQITAPFYEVAYAGLTVRFPISEYSVRDAKLHCRVDVGEE